MILRLMQLKSSHFKIALGTAGILAGLFFVLTYQDAFSQLRDTRLGIQVSDHGCSEQFGPVRHTPWATNGGGWSPWAYDGNAYDPDCVQLNLNIPFTYTLEPPADIEVVAGSSGSTVVTRRLVSGLPQPVSLSLSGLPQGATRNFTNNPCNPTCASTVTIRTSPSTPTGTYQITVQGMPLGRTTTFNLVVSTAPPPPRFKEITPAR